MKKYLFLINNIDITTEQIDSAVSTVKSDEASITVLFVADGPDGEKIAERLTDSGFVGDKPSSDISEVIVEQNKRISDEVISLVEKKSLEESVKFSIISNTGSTLKAIIEAVNSGDFDKVILCEKKRGFFDKLFNKSFVDNIKANINCPIEIL